MSYFFKSVSSNYFSKYLGDNIVSSIICDCHLLCIFFFFILFIYLSFLARATGPGLFDIFRDRKMAIYDQLG